MCSSISKRSQVSFQIDETMCGTVKNFMTPIRQRVAIILVFNFIFILAVLFYWYNIREQPLEISVWDKEFSQNKFGSQRSLSFGNFDNFKDRHKTFSEEFDDDRRRSRNDFIAIAVIMSTLVISNGLFTHFLIIVSIWKKNYFDFNFNQLISINIKLQRKFGRESNIWHRWEAFFPDDRWFIKLNAVSGDCQIKQVLSEWLLSNKSHIYD